MSYTTEPLPVATMTEPEKEEREVLLVERRETVRESLAAAWHCRNVLWPLASSLLTAMFDRTILGPFWIPIMVAMQTLGPALIFGKVLNAPTPSGIPYFLFFLVGMMVWRVFQRNLLFALRSFHRFARITRELSFPLLLVPIAATGGMAIEFITYVLFLAGMLVYFSLADGVLYLSVGLELLLAPLALLWALAFAWGIGFFTAPVFVRARDVRFILRICLPFWMFVTPIIYPLDHLQGTARTIAELNPMAPVVELWKLGVLGTGVADPLAVAWALFVTAVLIISGLWFLSAFGPRLIGIDRAEDEDEEDEAATMV